MEDESKISDHDLLIELRVTMKAVRDDIKELKSGTSTRIDTLETDKADRKEIDALQSVINNEIKKRLEEVEQDVNLNGNLFKAVLALGALILGLLCWHILGYHV